MTEADFPALYRSADDLSLASQKEFFLALRLHLILLVAATVLSVVSLDHWIIAVAQLVTLLGALSCSIYLFGKRPERYWYTARAIAESIKTVTWRYVCRAEPYQSTDQQARSDFQRTLKAIVDQNRDTAKSLTKHLDAPQITEGMSSIRSCPLEERKSFYAKNRINDQLTWYAKKAAFNRRTSSGFFWLLIAMNAIAVLFAILRIRFPAVLVWPTDIFVASAASLLSWMQAKRYSELAASYALAAHEIGLIREKSLVPSTDEEFSLFVGDAENAFSREHTQWVARRDI